SISGQYVGQVSVSPSGHGSSDASLSLQVTAGTGAFQGATGNLTGDGTGAFVTQGAFALSLRGSIVTADNPKGLRVQGMISGTSSLSCVIPNIVGNLDADGSFGKLGDAHAVLTHVIANAGCFS